MTHAVGVSQIVGFKSEQLSYMIYVIAHWNDRRKYFNLNEWKHVSLQQQNLCAPMERLQSQLLPQSFMFIRWN